MRSMAVFESRREIKREAKAVVRGHYRVLAFLAVLLILFGREYQVGKLFLNARLPSAEAELSSDSSMGSGTELSSDSSRVSEARIAVRTAAKEAAGDAAKVVEEAREEESEIKSGFEEVYTLLMLGKLTEGTEVSQGLTEQQKSRDPGKGTMYARAEGVFAGLVDTMEDGSLLVRVAEHIYALTKSQRAVSLVFIALRLAWSLFWYGAVQLLLGVVVRRIYLQARVYPKVKVSELFYIHRVRRVVRATLAMIWQGICLFLWSLTIVGGMIKQYSYWAIPYIEAENPDITPRQAMKLSRRMMDGHKWEIFLLELSFFPWVLLGVASFGLSEMVYGVPYRLAARCEAYARLRREAKEKEIEGIEALDDDLLFAPAEQEVLAQAYQDVAKGLAGLQEKVPLSGARLVLSEWFGIWLGSLREKKVHDEREAALALLLEDEEQMRGLSYPVRLNPRKGRKQKEKRSGAAYMRDYSVWTLILFFFLFSFFGWCWEVALHLFQTGELVNRGTMWGPWLPIYGSGGILVLCLCNRFRRIPVAEFFVSIALCGTVEYMTSWYLENRYQERWWSYDGYFLNLHGRICAEGLLIFGVGCVVVVYFAAPLLDYQISRMKREVQVGLCVALLAAFGADQVFSHFHPNMSKGAIESSALPGWADPMHKRNRVHLFKAFSSMQKRG